MPFMMEFLRLWRKHSPRRHQEYRGGKYIDVKKTKTLFLCGEKLSDFLFEKEIIDHTH